MLSYRSSYQLLDSRIEETLGLALLHEQGIKTLLKPAVNQDLEHWLRELSHTYDC